MLLTILNRIYGMGVPAKVHTQCKTFIETGPVPPYVVNFLANFF